MKLDETAAHKVLQHRDILRVIFEFADDPTRLVLCRFNRLLFGIGIPRLYHNCSLEWDNPEWDNDKTNYEAWYEANQPKLPRLIRRPLPRLFSIEERRNRLASGIRKAMLEQIRHLRLRPYEYVEAACHSLIPRYAMSGDYPRIKWFDPSPMTNVDILELPGICSLECFSPEPDLCRQSWSISLLRTPYHILYLNMAHHTPYFFKNESRSRPSLGYNLEALAPFTRKCGYFIIDMPCDRDYESGGRVSDRIPVMPAPQIHVILRCGKGDPNAYSDVGDALCEIATLLNDTAIPIYVVGWFEIVAGIVEVMHISSAEASTGVVQLGYIRGLNPDSWIHRANIADMLESDPNAAFPKYYPSS